MLLMGCLKLGPALLRHGAVALCAVGGLALGAVTLATLRPVARHEHGLVDHLAGSPHYTHTAAQTMYLKKRHDLDLVWCAATQALQGGCGGCCGPLLVWSYTPQSSFRLSGMSAPTMRERRRPQGIRAPFAGGA